MSRVMALIWQAISFHISFLSFCHPADLLEVARDSPSPICHYCPDLCFFPISLSSSCAYTVQGLQSVIILSTSRRQWSKSPVLVTQLHKNSDAQGSSAQSSSSQANNGIQNGNTQISGGQSYTSPAASISPALGVCPVNQGYPRNPGSCDSGFNPLVPSSVASDPNCPSGTASCQMIGHPGFCCLFSSRCCIDFIHQAACCPVGTCCEGIVSYGSIDRREAR